MARPDALAELQRRIPVAPGRELPERAAAPAGPWSLAALSGRLSELSGQPGALLSGALALVLDAQRQGDPVAWVAAAERGCFFPPDAAALGVDLAALVTVQVPDAEAAVRAAERLARAGAFGLVVLDLGPAAEVPAAWQGRLLNQARHHDLAVLFLTGKPARAPSLGSLIALRGQVRRRRAAPGRFAWEIALVKDKRRGPGRTHEEVWDGPPGLR